MYTEQTTGYIRQYTNIASSKSLKTNNMARNDITSVNSVFPHWKTILAVVEFIYIFSQVNLVVLIYIECHTKKKHNIMFL